jgi:hypothetical protein
MGESISRKTFWYALLLLVLADTLALVLAAVIMRHSQFVRSNAPGAPRD